jgi:5-methyltetrahydropteroyltriglutamate--homocysteine methyltransferase
VGSLPRPPDLTAAMLAYDRGGWEDIDGLRQLIRTATVGVVRKQAEIGLDIISDGEFGKTSYTAYIRDRLSGFDGEPIRFSRSVAEQARFPDYISASSGARVRMPSCNRPVALGDPSFVRRDVANFKEALQGVTCTDAFLTAASPGQIARFMPTTFYTSREEYVYALADAMRDEYETIVGSGFILQLDCPDLASGRSHFPELTIEQFRAEVATESIAALNYAVRGLPRDRLRLHICWGNYAGPHVDDVPLRDMVDVLLTANVGGLLFEAANPRHEHEWKLWRDVELPSGWYIVPGLIDSCTNYVEHPDLVAERLERFADTVGHERVLGGADCGFGTGVGSQLVASSVAWAKLQSLVDGAALASR